MANNTFGMHDDGAWTDLVLQACKSAWCVNTEALGCDPGDHSSKNYNTRDGSITHITRINNGYGNSGTIPLPERYGDFAQRCANFVHASTGCNHWIIGNEIGLSWEWPEGQQISLENYVKCFRVVRRIIKALQPNAIVMPQPPAPYNDVVKYAGNEIGDWARQLTDMLQMIGAGNVDGVAIHAYTHGHDANLITSEQKMNSPFDHRRFHFRTYIDFMEAIPQAFRDLPVFITEANPDGWENKNDGWIQSAYAEIDRWNHDANNQPIRCLAFYRWPTEDREQFHISTKQGVVDDFVQALQHDYRWSERKTQTVSFGSRIGNVVATAAFEAKSFVRTQSQVRIRNGAGLTSVVIDTLPAGVSCVIHGEKQEADGLTWWKVGTVVPGKAEIIGWCAEVSFDGTVILAKDTLKIASPVPHATAISQVFGENPNLYAPLGITHGHNGVDFATSVGTPIFAVADGEVIETGNDERGFGKYVKLRHSFGETIYAHLNALGVVQGEHVSAKQQIGLSGNTGFSGGPHLHWAIRINPYSRDDGSYGYSDGLGYLPHNELVIPDYLLG